MSEDRFGQLEQKIDSLGKNLRQDMRGLRDEMHGLYSDLGHQMRVLHEDTIDRIKALAPDLEPIRREFKAADTELRQGIDRRLSPLENEARARRRPRS
jgi:hypothetical protein